MANLLQIALNLSCLAIKVAQYICPLIYLALAPKKRRLPGVTMTHPFPSWPSPPSDTAVSGRSDGLAVGSSRQHEVMVKQKMRFFNLGIHKLMWFLLGINEIWKIVS